LLESRAKGGKEFSHRCLGAGGTEQLQFGPKRDAGHSLIDALFRVCFPVMQVYAKGCPMCDCRIEIRDGNTNVVKA
jgi:hypothetical protein